MVRVMFQVGDVPTCKEIVEVVSDYLDGGLSEADRACVEQHLVLCDGCDTLVDQMRFVAAESARLAPPPEPVDPRTADDLLAAFRARRK